MSKEQDLEAKNLALTAALDEAIAELKGALAYKSSHLVAKHKDWETVEELQQVLDLHSADGFEIFKEVQAGTIEALHFPVELRKMWSGGEVQEWLAEQAKNLRNQNGRFGS